MRHTRTLPLVVEAFTLLGLVMLIHLALGAAVVVVPVYRVVHLFARIELPAEAPK